MDIGQIIRQKRTAQSLSTRRLGAILGIDRSLISLYEHGKRKVSENHSKIIKAYLSGDYDIEIRNMLIDELRKKYEHLTGKNGLDMWDTGGKVS